MSSPRCCGSLVEGDASRCAFLKLSHGGMRATLTAGLYVSIRSGIVNSGGFGEFAECPLPPHLHLRLLADHSAACRGNPAASSQLQLPVCMHTSRRFSVCPSDSRASHMALAHIIPAHTSACHTMPCHATSHHTTPRHAIHQTRPPHNDLSFCGVSSSTTSHFTPSHTIHSQALASSNPIPFHPMLATPPPLNPVPHYRRHSDRVAF